MIQVILKHTIKIKVKVRIILQIYIIQKDNQLVDLFEPSTMSRSVSINELPNNNFNVYNENPNQRFGVLTYTNNNANNKKSNHATN